MTLISFPPVGQPASRIPADLEVEQALLGILMYDNAAHERISVPLAADHLYEPVHARLFATIEDHIRAGQLADPLTIAQRFQGDVAFEELGGVRYLADLVDKSPPAANAADYARVIHDLALRRELIEELGVTIGPATVWKVTEHDYPHALVRLHWCKVWAWTGEFEMREGQSMAWQQMPITVSPVLPGAYPVLQWLAEERGLQSAV
eukprot:gene27055-48553_t